MRGPKQRLSKQCSDPKLTVSFRDEYKLDRNLLFVNSHLEKQYVAYVIQNHYYNAPKLALVLFGFFIGVAVYGGIKSLSDSDWLVLIMGFVGNATLSLVLLWLSRQKWAMRGNTIEYLVACFMVCVVCVSTFTLAPPTYSFSSDCSFVFNELEDHGHDDGNQHAEVDDDAVGYCVHHWFAFLVQLPLVLFTAPVACISVKLVRFHYFRIVLVIAMLAHALRSLWITPLPPKIRFLWALSSYVVLPFFVYLTAASQELDNRKLFIHHVGLKKQRDSLERELGAAQRALAFEGPTAKERAIVGAVLGGGFAAGLADVELSFEDLEFHERVGAGSFGEVIRATYGGSVVAVKRLLRTRIDEKNIQLVREEVLLLRQLRHPNVVQFVCSGAGCLRTRIDSPCNGTTKSWFFRANPHLILWWTMM